jgi:hypothetical protein
MVSKAEAAASRSLRIVLSPLSVGDTVEESLELTELHFALEIFLPEVLSESSAFWRAESFDGFRWAVARKTGSSDAEFLGLGLLISDQSWTPLHVRMTIEPKIDAISRISCNVGDGGPGGKRMTRLPYASSKESKLLFSVGHNPEAIDWAFSVTRGAHGSAV